MANAHKVSDPKANQLPAMEASPVDGAFYSANHGVEVPAPGSTSTEKLLWATAQTKVMFLNFDCKYVSLSPLGRTELLEYAFTVNGGKSHHNPDADVYILAFEGLPDFLAIVPKAAWEHASDFAYNIDPLLNRVPAFCQPFMVHTSQIAQAVKSLVDAGSGTWYTNPTTGFTLTGYVSRRTTRPSLVPVEARMAHSYTSVSAFWRKIIDSGEAKAHLNPIQPLICDFLLEIPGLSELLSVEHKVMAALSGLVNGNGIPVATRVTFEVGDRSPFSLARDHHVVICQAPGGVLNFICCLRHEFEATWSTQHSPLTSTFLKSHTFIGPSGFADMMRFIADNAEKAIAAADQALGSSRHQDKDVELLFNTNCDPHLIHQDQLIFQDDEESSELGRNRSSHARGLQWVCDRINEQCAEAGELICFPLDIGHPLGDHVIVEHNWTPDEKLAYTDRGRHLPAHIFSNEISSRKCVILRFMDLSCNEHAWPISMRRAYWTRPALEQHYLILGSTMDATVSTEAESMAPYLLLPSGFTKQFDHGFRGPVSSEAYRGEKYFRHILLSDDSLPEPQFSTTRTEARPITKGSAFMKVADVDPCRYIFNLHDGSLYQQIRGLMTGSGTTSFDNVQSGTGNRIFQKDTYWTTPSSVLKAAWDFGRTLLSLASSLTHPCPFLCLYLTPFPIIVSSSLLYHPPPPPPLYLSCRLCLIT